MGAGRERVAAQGTQIDIQHTPALGSVDVDVDVAAVGHIAQLRDRELDPAHVRGVGQRQHPRAGGERPREDVDQLLRTGGVARGGDPRHREAEPRRPDLPRHVVRRVVLVPDDHLVSGLERQPVVDDVVGLARVADQRDLVGGDVQPPRHPGPGRPRAGRRTSAGSASSSRGRRRA